MSHQIPPAGRPPVNEQPKKAISKSQQVADDLIARAQKLRVEEGVTTDVRKKIAEVPKSKPGTPALRPEKPAVPQPAIRKAETGPSFLQSQKEQLSGKIQSDRDRIKALSKPSSPENMARINILDLIAGKISEAEQLFRDEPEKLQILYGKAIELTDELRRICAETQPKLIRQIFETKILIKFA